MAEPIYITEEQAIAHLRLSLLVDGNSPATIIDSDYPILKEKMVQAEDIIIDYLKTIDSGWTSETIPPRIRAAMLLMLSALWDDREGVGDAGDYLKDDGPIAQLLRRSRDPALA
jgi:hypothetical protein